MPFLAIATNVKVPAETKAMLVKEASEAVAAGTGKPEQYVVVTLRDGQGMLFAGKDGPAAWLEVKSIGYPANGVKRLAAELCELMTKRLGVPGERVYVVFEDVKAGMWGHDGETFG